MLALGAGGGASAADPPRIDLKVLLISADGSEPTFGLWKSTLDREGVPYDAIVATTAPPITPEQLADGTTHARYQAVILATGNLAYFDGSVWSTALAPDEWNALADYEAAFGIRRVSAYVFPGPEYGLNTPTAAGDWGGTVGAVTAAGAASFPELVGPVPVEPQSWGYESTPIDPLTFSTLVTGKNGAPMVGVYTHPEDGRQELVVTLDANQYGQHGLLLQHGILRWATKGVYLGYKRAYLGLHFDDVFLANDRWDVNANTTPDGGPRPIKMRLSDTARALSWQNQNRLRMDMVFNGSGASNVFDPFTLSMYLAKSLFGWVNHTYTHENLDTVSQAVLQSEIGQNISFANRWRLPNFDAAELVTGEHSGLLNPAMPAALTATGIKWLASDASRTFNQAPLGPALTLPRYPTNVYFNVGTKAEQLDEYNYVYYEHCTNTSTTTCFTAPATWDQYVNSNATQMLQHVLANDPRPHYFHQSNLAEEGVFYPVANELLARYRAYLKPALVQVTQKDATLLLQRFDRWRAALAAGQVSGYLQGTQVVISSSVAIDAPVTGTSVGETWGGDRSGWTHLNAGQTATVTPTNAPPPTSASAVQGEARVGATLTAPTTGNAYTWLRCNDKGEACGRIRGADDRTYTVDEDDAGSTIRVLVWTRDGDDWDVVRSDPSDVVAAASPPASPTVVNTAPPAISGEARLGEQLTATTGTWVGASEYRYEWSRCERGRCVSIDGAIGPTYRPTGADLGDSLRVSVRGVAGDEVSAPVSSALTNSVRGTHEWRGSHGARESERAAAEAAARWAAWLEGARRVNGR